MTDHAAAMHLWQATDGVGLSEADSFSGISQFLVRNPGLSLVAFAKGELVGTVLCGHDGRRGFIHHLVVAPSYRRRGLGKELVSRCLTALSSLGITKCHLFVFRDNSDGHEFWRRIGGEERTSLVTFSFATGKWANQRSEPTAATVARSGVPEPRQP